MIYIFSEESDFSTKLIAEWLSYFKCEFKIITPIDFTSKLNIFININDNNNDINNNIIKKNKEKHIYYLRRWSFLKNNIKNSELQKQLYEINKKEFGIFTNYIFYKLLKYKWINHYSNCFPIKLKQLEIAQRVGLKIPKSVITTRKKNISLNNNLITKPLDEMIIINKDDIDYVSYSNYVNINELSETFQPSLFQEKINKKCDLRVFFWNNNFFSTAIEHDLTNKNIDFRINQVSSKMFPFQLPVEIKNKLKKFMKILNLQTGSIDMILSDKNEFVFIEVNPSGQFHYYSNICNFNLEMKIAMTLKKTSNT